MGKEYEIAKIQNEARDRYQFPYGEGIPHADWNSNKHNKVSIPLWGRNTVHLVINGIKAGINSLMGKEYLIMTKEELIAVASINSLMGKEYKDYAVKFFEPRKLYQFPYGEGIQRLLQFCKKKTLESINSLMGKEYVNM